MQYVSDIFECRIWLCILKKQNTENNLIIFRKLSSRRITVKKFSSYFCSRTFCNYCSDFIYNKFTIRYAILRFTHSSRLSLVSNIEKAYHLHPMTESYLQFYTRSNLRLSSATEIHQETESRDSFCQCISLIICLSISRIKINRKNIIVYYC